ncbi:hypothetical protein SAMN04488128_103237 [Chitinophaga eiseniae]|uniref:Uncharacterized protein n=1 Tax=Chitinophaga eiseniae TaxID=634771 RepID=A0A1T4SPI0_9BACT|nr:hypothetical protein [Chitinophaga eiseniae]SKA30194.1 hypothetical protein SAMN04488128_103237 [Chitinophaga eiseniae]
MNKPVNEITFHLINEGLPEDIQPALWWYKGDGCPPYCGSMTDDDFPNIDFFFAWCEIPNPSLDFWNKYNMKPPAVVDLQKENLKLHIQLHHAQEQIGRQEEQIKKLLVQLAEKGGRENEEGEQTTSDTPAC